MREPVGVVWCCCLCTFGVYYLLNYINIYCCFFPHFGVHHSILQTNTHHVSDSLIVFVCAVVHVTQVGPPHYTANLAVNLLFFWILARQLRANRWTPQQFPPCHAPMGSNGAPCCAPGWQRNRVGGGEEWIWIDISWMSGIKSFKRTTTPR